MGVWGTKLTDDDFALDVIQDFLDAYNEGRHPEEIRRALETSYAGSLSNEDEVHVFWLALAKVQWDIGALDEDVFQKVRTIVEEDLDSISWKGRGASDKDIKQRRLYLQSFLNKITVPRKNPKKRKKKILRAPHYEMGDVIVFQISDGRFSAAVVIDAENQTEYGTNVVVKLDLVQHEQPTINDVIRSNVLIALYQSIRKNIDFEDRIEVAHYSINRPTFDTKPGEVIGTIKVKQIKEAVTFYSSWENFTLSFEQSLTRKSTKKLSLKKYLGYNLFQKIKILNHPSEHR